MQAKGAKPNDGTSFNCQFCSPVIRGTQAQKKGLSLAGLWSMNSQGKRKSIRRILQLVVCLACLCLPLYFFFTSNEEVGV